MIRFRQISCVLSISMVMSGCATKHTWEPGPTAQGTFDEAKGRCTLMANHSGGGFAASGSPSFVAGAALGAAINADIRAQNDFNACMSAAGWVADDMKAADLDKLKADVKAAKDESTACIAAVRADPRYSTIISHMMDPAVGRYTYTQMANDKLPTVEEATVLSGFEDAIEKCRVNLEKKVTTLNPMLGSRVREGFSAGREAVLLLVTRKISWGEYAKRIQAIQDGQAGQKA